MNYIVRHREDELLKYENRINRKKIDEILDPDFFEIAQSGQVIDKATTIEILPDCPEEKYVVKDYKERILAEDIILVTYRLHREIINNNVKRITLCSSIWKKNNNVWQMTFFQGTPAKHTNI